MILKRKKETELVFTPDGAPRPDIIATIVAPINDALNKVLHMQCGFYHSAETFAEGKKPIPEWRFGWIFRDDLFRPAEFNEKEELIKLGFPSYSEVMQSIEIGKNGLVTEIADDVRNWVLWQVDSLDPNGKQFGVDWEFAD